ncbi:MULTISPECIES: GDSL family lysophospholipase PlaA [unclassified Legionella]|uniref:GDSL family lysophospholipase PlaA n=1 Tax=unclassified Legionella TaxID=2622702 RepID=UPI00105464BA|nr:MULTISPECIES: SGNH/GDSL hydrolase family protein [unclassified Legionella]MDI9819104.1 SGNH/GDSL hydrolase family protein [Legionella sp. PL877]
MKILSTLFFLMFSALAAAKPLHNIVVFGDSLSDNGNLYEYLHQKLPQSPPYHEGRFTNGPVWIERLTELYFPTKGSEHLLDYAFGGAGIAEDQDDLFTLKKEIDTYFLVHQDKVDEDSLFVIWIGANNYLGIPDDIEGTVSNTNAGIRDGIRRLVDAGAKHIMVLNLPDLGQTPLAREFNAQAALTHFSTRHNEVLAENVNALKHAYPDVQWLYFDVHQTLNNLVVEPEKYGFTNITETCYEAMVEKPSKHSVLRMAASIKAGAEPSLCQGYLFFDPVHPTVLAHQIMAEHAKRFLDQNGIEF